MYNEIFLTAAHHPNLRIQCITRPAPGKRILDSTPKCVLDETEKMVEKSPSQLKCDSVTKNKEETEKAKEVRVVGSFLSRKSVNTKPVSNKPLERDEKKKLILPDPDSQVSIRNAHYVLSCYTFLYFTQILIICKLYI